MVEPPSRTLPQMPVVEPHTDGASADGGRPRRRQAQALRVKRAYHECHIVLVELTLLQQLVRCFLVLPSIWFVAAHAPCNESSNKCFGRLSDFCSSAE